MVDGTIVVDEAEPDAEVPVAELGDVEDVGLPRVLELRVRLVEERLPSGSVPYLDGEAAADDARESDFRADGDVFPEAQVGAGGCRQVDRRRGGVVENAGEERLRKWRQETAVLDRGVPWLKG